MNNKYPEHIMVYLRERKGLEKNDTSQDDIINAMSKYEAFQGLNFIQLIKLYMSDKK